MYIYIYIYELKHLSHLDNVYIYIFNIGRQFITYLNYVYNRKI